MSICSYETIARYDDDCTRKVRVRSIDNIRSKNREALHKSRHSIKILNMLHNRRTLAETVLNNIDDDDSSVSSFNSHEQYGQSDRNSSPDAANQNCDYGTDTWPSDCLLDQTDGAPSSDWSCHGVSRSASLTIEPQNVPAFFFETPETSTNSSPNDRSSRVNASSQRQHLYKTASGLQSKNGTYCDFVTAKQQLDELKNSIVNTHGDAELTSGLIQINWQVILTALRSSNDTLIHGSIELLKTLATESLITPCAVLHMLQHGLVIAARDTLHRPCSESVGLVHLFSILAYTTPACIPYMVDQMSSSKMLADMNDRMMSGSLEELQVIIDFYYFITESMFTHLYKDARPEQQQIMVPEILRITGISKQSLESYSPVSTLNKCISTNLIRNVAKRVLNRAVLKEDALISRGLLLLANAIKLIHYRTNAEKDVFPQKPSEDDSAWLGRLLAVFRDCDIAGRMSDMDKAFDRTIKLCDSSEHFSQGVGVGEGAARSKEQCQQFLAFYQEQYGYLSPKYEKWINQWQVGYESPQRRWDMD